MGLPVVYPIFFFTVHLFLPCVGSFAVCHEHFTDTCMPCVAHGKAFAVCNMSFAVCPRHTANYSIPVVHVRKGPLARETEQSGEDK